ncbi:hypothetical protein AURDEDRAFT_178536, partial [Auricularia subglabra TFB-10046 SS5]
IVSYVFVRLQRQREGALHLCHRRRRRLSRPQTPFNLALVSPPADIKVSRASFDFFRLRRGSPTRRRRRLGSSSGAKHGSTGAVLSPAAGNSLLLIHFFFRLRRATDTAVRGSEIAGASSTFLSPAAPSYNFDASLEDRQQHPPRARKPRHRAPFLSPAARHPSLFPIFLPPAAGNATRWTPRGRRVQLTFLPPAARCCESITLALSPQLPCRLFQNFVRLRRARVRRFFALPAAHAPTILYATRLALFVALASASVLVERHTPSSCSGAAADSTRKCTVKSGECCPADWSCVVPADGTEVCLQNARSSACPAGYAVKNNVCVLSGTPVTSGVASTATGGNSAVTSVIAVTTTSLSTSFSTSGSATIAVTVPVPITTSATTILVPTTTGVPSVSVSHSLSTSGGSTFTVPVNVTLTSAATDTASLSVSTSFSQSG